jgi:hypothetical protein
LLTGEGGAANSDKGAMNAFFSALFLKLAQWQNVDLAISLDAGSVAKTREFSMLM